MKIQALFLLLAEDKPAEAPQVNPFMQFLPFILIFVIFYFVLIRPQKKRQQAMAEMVSALKTGDKVITAGGIHGLVTNVKERSVTVKVAENTKIEFEKPSIATVIKKGEAAPPPAETAPPLDEQKRS